MSTTTDPTEVVYGAFRTRVNKRRIANSTYLPNMPLGTTVYGLMSDTGLPDGTVRRAIKKLVEDGRLIRQGGGSRVLLYLAEDVESRDAERNRWLAASHEVLAAGVGGQPSYSADMTVKTADVLDLVRVRDNLREALKVTTTAFPSTREHRVFVNRVLDGFSFDEALKAGLDDKQEAPA